jgi:hypothetical protein
MRRSRIRGLASVLVLFVLAFGTALLWEFTSGASAVEHLAPTSPVSPRQNITFDFTSVTFVSGGGGAVFGRATLSGSIRGTELSRLRGSLTFPLKGYTLLVDPTAPAQSLTVPTFVFWFDPSTGQFGSAVFNVTTVAVPVDIHFGSFHGRGTLSFVRSSTCVSGQCPPPGASVFGLPFGSNLNGAVGSPQDAGSLFMNGPPPTIE